MQQDAHSNDEGVWMLSCVLSIPGRHTLTSFCPISDVFLVEHACRLYNQRSAGVQEMVYFWYRLHVGFWISMCMLVTDSWCMQRRWLWNTSTWVGGYLLIVGYELSQQWFCPSALQCHFLVECKCSFFCDEYPFIQSNPPALWIQIHLHHCYERSLLVLQSLPLHILSGLWSSCTFCSWSPIILLSHGEHFHQ